MSIKSIERRDASEKVYIKKLQKEFSSLKVSLENELNLIDFAHVSTLSFGIYDKILKSKVEFNRKSSINFYRKARLKTIPKKLFLAFPSMYLPILKRNSLRKIRTFVFHLSNLNLPTIWPILNCFIDKSVI